MDNEDWHALGMGASMIVFVLFILFLLVCVWGAVCGITGSHTGFCS